MKLRKMMHIGVTAGLVALVAMSSMMTVSAKGGPSSMAGAKQLLMGKKLSASKRCNGCHGAALKGIPNFSPSLHETGVLKEYNKKSFEVVLASGKTNDGGMVMKPMPIYHMPAPQADALYAYFKTLK